MNEHEKWLQKRLNKNHKIDKDEQWLIDYLVNKSRPEAERWACVDTLEVLLCFNALPNLVLMLKDETLTDELRKRVAKAIAAIDSSYVETELDALRSSASPKLTSLLDLAQMKIAP